MWLLDKMLRRLITRGQLVVIDHDNSITTYGDPKADPVCIRFTDAGAARHIARDPRVGAGEAYMDGRLVVMPPHDIRDMVLLVMGNAGRSGGAVGPSGLLGRLIDRVGWLVDQIELPGKPSANIAHHYELTRAFYDLFLDADRQYSMAYFSRPGLSLEGAQTAKKALIAAKLAMPANARGMRVLDIGCGWGGMALFLNRHYGCEVLGVSLAPDQVRFANERAEAAGVADKVRFELLDYREAKGPFDRITSVGMIEHVGAKRFGEYFARTRELLADSGVMLTHTIGRTDGPGITDKWTRKYVFPGGYIPAMGELVRPMETGGWIITDIEVLRYHYAETIAEWYKRATANAEQIAALYDERLLRMWLFYLAGAEQAFRTASMVNFHVQSVKRADVLPVTRDYIAIEAARLVAAEGGMG